MQNLKQKLSGFVKHFKLKFFKTRVVPLEIAFENFFPFENLCSSLGYPFLSDKNVRFLKWKKFHSILYEVSTIALLFAIIISAWILLNEPITDESINVIIENVLFMGMIIAAMTKIIIIFHIKRRALFNIIGKLRCQFPQATSRFQTRDHLKILNFFARVYATYVTVGVIQFCSMPIIHQIYGIMTLNPIEWEPIIAIHLPLYQSRFAAYAINYAFQAWFLVVSVIFIFCTDFTFVNLIHILCLNFHELGQMIRELSCTDVDSLEKLKNLIKKHQQLIEISDEIEEVFSFVLFINVFASIIALCTGAFLTIVSINSSSLIEF